MKKFVYDCRGNGYVHALPGDFVVAIGAYLCNVKQLAADTYVVIGDDGNVFGVATVGYNGFLELVM